MSSTAIRSEASGLARFCAVGALGFVIDAGLLIWFTAVWGLDPLLARVFSILLALTMTWAMHRNWTFGSSASPRLAEWGRFAAANIAGGVLNYAVYAAVLIALPAATPLMALAAGSAVALAVNYLASRLWAFRPAREP